MTAVTDLLSRVNRRRARRGAPARIELADGRTVTGTLQGWGTYMVRFLPDMATVKTGWSWKVHDLAVGQVTAVYQTR